jgi:hypothetical protein
MCVACGFDMRGSELKSQRQVFRRGRDGTVLMKVRARRVVVLPEAQPCKGLPSRVQRLKERMADYAAQQRYSGGPEYACSITPPTAGFRRRLGISAGQMVHQGSELPTDGVNQCGSSTFAVSSFGLERAAHPPAGHRWRSGCSIAARRSFSRSTFRSCGVLNERSALTWRRYSGSVR